MNGLILIGGRGTRLGEVDKSLLFFNEMPQREFLKNLLRPYCQEIYFSCRQDQLQNLNELAIVDPHEQGPLGGILSALESNWADGWLVVACDMPNLTPTLIQKLVECRNKNKMATVFFNTATQTLEPLLAIYEQSSTKFILESHQNGQRSPMKILKNIDIQEVEIEESYFFKNINTPEDLI